MKREIKFRAWDLERKKMIHFANKGICSEYNQLTFDVQEKEEKEYLGCLPENENILMQFTGLKDKNGKEIYEGDILKWDTTGSGDEDIIDKVIWNDEAASFDFGEIICWYEDTKEYEIIGNIYENPELIKTNDNTSNNN